MWSARNVIRSRREQTVSKCVHDNDGKVSFRALENFKKLIEDDTEHKFILKIPQLIKKKTEDINSETSILSTEYEEIKRRNQGYVGYIKESGKNMVPSSQHMTIMKQ